MDPITAQIEGMEFLIVLIIGAVLLLLIPRYLAPALRRIGQSKSEYEMGKLEGQRKLDAMKEEIGKR